MRKKAVRRMGLARAISKLGYCSRSRAEALIRSARVRLNGKVCLDPETPTHSGKERIEIDDKAISAAYTIYIVLNKPRGVVATASDEQGRDTVYHLLPPDLSWIAPVGRLDKASEGLLLMTNDSGWAARISAPETCIAKTYHVQVNTVRSQALLDAMIKGARCDGELLRAKSARFLRGGQRNSWIEVVLEEGRNRQIRRLLAQLGVSVLRLVRVAVGPLELGDLPKGQWRYLSGAQKLLLDQAMLATMGMGKTSISQSCS